MKLSHWLVLLPLPLLLLIALICWVLSRRTPTRRLGYLAAGGLGLSLAALAAAMALESAPLEWGQRPWLAAYGIDGAPVALSRLAIRVDGLSAAMGLVALAGGTLGVLYLARSLAASLVGYGRLWSALLLMLCGVLAGLWADDLLLLVFGWGVAVAGAALARRSVGGADTRPPIALTTTLLGGLGLLAAALALAVRPGGPLSGQYGLATLDNRISLAVFAPLLLATLVALGLPPWAGVVTDDEGGPPALHGLLLGMGLPLLGGYVLLRVFGATLGAWPRSWLAALSVVGALGLLGGGSGALRATRFGPLIGWQLSAQLGAALLLMGQYDPRRPAADPLNVLTLAAVALMMLIAAWSTLLAALALAALERRSGSDELTRQQLLAAPLRIAGLGYGLAAAAATGLPPLTGFWARRWLLDGIVPAQPWLMPLLTAGGGLLALSYLGPLALFWRHAAGAGDRPGARNGTPDRAVIALAALPLLLAALAPQLLWRVGLRDLLAEILPAAGDPLGAGPAALALPGPAEQIGLGLALLALAWIAARAPGAQLPQWSGGEALERDAGTPHAPQAIGHTLRGLALLADPRPLFGLLGRGLDRTSAAAAWALQLVSGRYYLTGVLIAALTLILLLVQ